MKIHKHDAGHMTGDIIEPRCEKTGLKGFGLRVAQPHKIDTGLKFRI